MQLQGLKMIGDFKKEGEREIVFVDTFIIPQNETLEFSFSPSHPQQTGGVFHNRFTLSVKVKTGDVDDSVKAEWSSSDHLSSFVLITLPVAKGRIGGVMSKPMKIGDVSNKPLGFQVAFSESGGDYLVTLQFVLGGNYE
jgi:hypothetical protein